MKYLVLNIIILIGISSNAQIQKDTLFFNYDSEYMIENFDGKMFSVKDTGEDEEYFMFVRGSASQKLKPAKILNLKNFIRSSSFYDNSREPKLDDYRLSRFLEGYEIFLVEKGKDGKNKFTKLHPATAIAD